MNEEHFVVLGAARARAPWLTEIGRWSTSSALPVEFLRCVSVDEVRARLGTDRRYSAVLLDERCIGLDRDLLEVARAARCTPIIVSSARPMRDWVELGASCVLIEPLDPSMVLAALRDHALGIERHRAIPLHTDDPAAPMSRLVTVAGPGGSGTSTLAMAIAGRFAPDRRVALLDGALDADQALLHDLGDVVPGLPELVEIHRTSAPSPDEVRRHLWACPTHGYDVLPGLRRHRDWSTMRQRNLIAAIRSVRAAFDLVIADTDLDLEGESDTGSLDVEDRNTLSRHLVATADVVVVTARAGASGIRRLLHGLAILDDHDIDRRRILPVVIGAPRTTTQRAELNRTLLRLVTDAQRTPLVNMPVLLPLRRDLEPFVRDSARLPGSVGGAVAIAVSQVLAATEPMVPEATVPTPVPVGRLGRTA